MKMERAVLLTAVVSTAAFIGSVLFYQFCGLNIFRRRKKWYQVGKLSEIIIYPLKAGSGIHLEQAFCTKVGLSEKRCDGKFVLGDRLFIAFEEGTGMRISCKNSPIICKIKIVSVGENSVEISVPGFERCQFTVPDNVTNKVNCMIYIDIPSETFDCGDEVANWLSNVILKKNKGVRLGMYVRDQIKQRDDTAGMLKNYKKLYPEMKEEYLGAYSFLASYLLINQSSLDDLNDRLPPEENSVTSFRLRSNLTISGEIEPYDEDKWKCLRIGENVILKNIKPCTRCLVINLNPESAQFSQNLEPLRTLKKYRLLQDEEKNKAEEFSPVFGQYYGLHKEGYIKVNDPVYALID